MYDVEKIRKNAKKDFEKEWLSSSESAEKKGRKFSLRKGSSPHPVMEFARKFRDVLLSMGLEETILPVMIDESDIYRQYGPEGAVILDRIFYLAGLERPEIGIDSRRKAELSKILDESRMKILQKILREYKKGKIEADDLIESMVGRLDIGETDASAILAMFAELKELRPVPSKMTLRSHTTSLWFPTLSALLKKKVLPIQLFSIGEKFRREQKLDSTHLYSSYTASVAVMAGEMTLEDGEMICKEILKRLGFRGTSFETKKATSKYYIPGTEFEIFVKHPKTGVPVEVGNAGFYNPVSLANYKIPYPVFNVGFGVERMVMILTGEEDIRKLTYPQYYGEKGFSDAEIAESIELAEQPETHEGKKIMEAIKNGIIKHKDDKGICRFSVHKGKGIEVFVSEPEEGKALLGPAGMNTVYVLGGDILGIDEKNPKFSEAAAKGKKSFSYIDAVSAVFASRIERGERGRMTVRTADGPHSINLALAKPAENFISSKNKRIDIRGPIFIDVEAVEC